MRNAAARAAASHGHSRRNCLTFSFNHPKPEVSHPYHNEENEHLQGYQKAGIVSMVDQSLDDRCEPYESGTGHKYPVKTYAVPHPAG